MGHPYPERNRRQRLDRRDHSRHSRDQHGPRGEPSERQIERALSSIATHDTPGTPRVGALKLLRELHESEWVTDTREVRDFSVKRGRPEHGALRSDDHVGSYVVTLPFAEVDDDAVAADLCRRCGHERALYTYSAHHHISGNDAVECVNCDYTHYSTDW